jgi:hypothetical protein
MDSRAVVYELKKVLDYVQRVPQDPIHRVERLVNYMENVHADLLELKRFYQVNDISNVKINTDSLVWMFEMFYSDRSGFRRNLRQLLEEIVPDSPQAISIVQPRDIKLNLTGLNHSAYYDG